MTPKQFDICLSFHLGLIRSRPHKQTVDDARNHVINSASKNLMEALEERYLTLTNWIPGGPILQHRIYNKHNTRNPKPEVFTAAFGVMHGGAEISKAAKAAGVNYQSVKVLIPRLKRWERYAKKLTKTL